MAEPFVKPSHKGRLHRALNIPENQTIPKARIAAATHSTDPHMKKMAIHAQNMQKGENAPNMARGFKPKGPMPAPSSPPPMPAPMPGQMPNMAKGRKVPNMAKGNGKWAARKGQESM